MAILRQAESSAAEDKLTRAIQRVREQYKGDFGAFFRDYQESVLENPKQRELPFTPKSHAEHSGE